MKRNLLIVLGVTLFFALLGFRYRTEVKIGYAGDPQRYSDVLTITPLFLNREDIELARENFVLTSGYHQQENSLRWSSSGYVPVKGDLIEVMENRLTWYGYLVHGWGYTKPIPQYNYELSVDCTGWLVVFYQKSFDGQKVPVGTVSGTWSEPRFSEDIAKYDLNFVLERPDACN